ncbi:MAG: MFS transporter [Gemmatimonadetes bacterium]|nr:MFS transporter [Gemmatimonadota bacterium]
MTFPAISGKDRTRVFAAVLLALFLAALDQTIVSTALPKIVEDLRGVDRYAWVVTAYLLASTSLVPVYGKLADTYSRKAIELVAIGLFLTGSFLCGLAGEWGTLPVLGDGMNQLIAFRAIQGLGGAGLFAMTFIIIADLYPPAVRGKYQGFVGAVFGVASILGPLAGGLLTDHATGWIPGVEGWRWVFYVNVPFGALAVWFVVTRMPPLRPAGAGGGVDWVGAAALVVGMVSTVLVVQSARDPRMEALMIAGAVACLVFFVRRSLTHPSPLLDLGLFRNAVFRRANIAGFFSGASFLSVIVFLPLFLVNVLGVSATRAGVALIPLSMGVVFGATLAGQLVSRIGHYRWIMTVGLSVLAVGIAMLSRLTVDTGYSSVAAIMVLCGAGIGPTFPLFTLAIQNAVPVTHLGQATSAAQFFRQIGGTFGAAAMGAVMAVTLTTHLAQLDGTRPGWAGYEAEPEVLATTGGSELELEVTRHFVSRTEALLSASGEDPPSFTEDELPGFVRDLLEEAPVDPHAVARAMGFAAEDVVEEVRHVVRSTFALAVRRIYGATLVLVLVAAAVTAALPELPLRKEHDAEVAAPPPAGGRPLGRSN